MQKVSTASAKQSRNFSQPELIHRLDLGDRSSWYCGLDEAGEIVVEQKLGTTPKATPTGLLMEGDYISLRSLFAEVPGNECYRDISTTTIALPASQGLSFEFSPQGVCMSKHHTPQFSNFAPWGVWLLGSVLGSALSMAAQQPSGANTQTGPDSSVTRQSATPATNEGSAAKFIGYATNPSTFFPDIATSPGPLTTGGKFKLFVNQSISPPYILESGISAAFDQARDVPKGYGQGWAAYGSRFGADMARSSSSSFFGTFLLASLLHQDPRFFPESKPSFWRSLKYSTQRIVLTRNDSGKDVFNTSGLLGPLASEGLANVYLPSSEQTVGKTLTRFASDLAWRVGGNMFKNYWPTFFRNMGLNRLKVIPDPGNVPGHEQARPTDD